jgi:nucleoid DNA-binding protein
MAGISQAARLAGLSEYQVLTFFNVVADMVSDGVPVYVRNFGTFYLRHKPPRTIRSPLIPGGVTMLPMRRVLEFRHSPKLNAMFAGGRAKGVVRHPARKRKPGTVRR